MSEIVVVHANCQGEMLAGLLRGHQPFAARYECLLFTNYIMEPIPEEVLAHSSAFLYQYLDPKWGELSSDALLARLPATCRSLAIPNMFMRMYWPLHKTGQNGSMRETLLDDILERGVERAELQFLASKKALLKGYDLQGIVQRSIAHERKKEATTPIKYVDMMLDGGRRERLFYTLNHPGEKLLRHVADAVLAWLDLPPLADGALNLDDYYTSFELPVHPGVANLFDLEFCHENTRFSVYGVPMTWAQYAGVYADYRAHAKATGMDSFIEYMGDIFAGGD